MFLTELLYFTCLTIVCFISEVLAGDVDLYKSLIWGPGLSPVDVVMPARYFYIQTVDENNNTLSTSPGNVFDIVLKGHSDKNRDCRLSMNVLDRKDGSYIVRYKLFETCHNFEINIKYKETHVAGSPYKSVGPIYSEECYCPVETFQKWYKKFGCKRAYAQIDADLKPFASVNFTEIRNDAVLLFSNNPGSMSVCNYIIKDNQIFRECFGKYVGFNMFVDAILLSLTRKFQLPDMEMLFNLGDWPLIKANNKDIPMFSWCGSDETLDIVLPTYDITEAALQCMGRVMLDMLSVQGNIDKTWDEKVEKAFWRGRDSRRERLQLIDIARSYPDLFNASITNFFFFRDEEEKYGPKEKHVSFFNFFDYKYQINIDGTVAAYRFPYLLAGDSLVLKQSSSYYEFFYKELKPWKHYVPVQSDLSDLVQRIIWAKENDDVAKSISRNGQKFARENLMPHDVFCYHAILFEEWSKRLASPVEIRDTMEHVQQPDSQCICRRPTQTAKQRLHNRDEL